MRFISLLARAVTALAVFSAGAAVVAGLTHYLITSQAMDDAHALKAWTIAGGIIAGGAFLPFMTGKARVLLVVGILAAEAFNIGMIAETTWRTRAAAHAERLEAHTQTVADHAARVKAHTDAESRLVRAEAAADAKEQARAADASKRDCKRECMAGHLEAVTAARADVTSARTALAATPLPGVAPTLPETGDELGRHWDLAMAVLSSIGGNLIAIGLFAFAGALLAATDTLFRGASDAHPHPRSASRPEGAGHASISEPAVHFVPQITIAENAAQAERLRAVFAPKPLVMVQPDEQFAAVKARALAAGAERSPLAALFGGEQPEPADNVVRLFHGPNGSPDGSGGPKGGRKVRQTPRANDRKADVLADIQTRIDRGERFASQEDLRAALAERFGHIAKSSLSDWLGELSGQIVRRQDGRRKVVG